MIQFYDNKLWDISWLTAVEYSVTQKYESARKIIEDKLHDKISEIENIENKRIPNEIKEKCIQATHDLDSMYIGEGSEIANKAILDFIENDLFSVKDGILNVNIKGFKTIEVPDYVSTLLTEHKKKQATVTGQGTLQETTAPNTIIQQNVSITAEGSASDLASQIKKGRQNYCTIL